MATSNQLIWKRVTVFLLVGLLIHFLLIFSYLKVMEESFIVKTDKEFHKETNNSEVNYLIMGSSHSFGLIGYHMNNAVHFGSYGEDISRTYYKLKYVCEGTDIKPKHIVLNYDLGMVSQNIGLADDNLFYWVKYVNFLELGRKKDALPEYLYKYVKGRVFPYADGEMDVFEYLFPPEKNQQLLRSDTLKRLNNDESTVDVASCLDEQLDGAGLYYFKEIVRLCKKYQIQLVLLKFPVTERYFQRYASCLDVTYYYNYLDRIAFGLYSEGVHILDYQKVYFENNENFRDSHHLNGTIRPIFTRMVEKDLAEIHTNL